MEKLLQHPDINVNAENVGGFRSLYYACVFNRYEIVEKLLADSRVDSTKERLMVQEGRFSPQIKELFFPIEYTNVRTLPTNSTDAIFFEPIKEGNTMANFRANADKMESNYGRYYKKNTYNQFVEPKQNPMTRQPIQNIAYYKAHFDA